MEHLNGLDLYISTRDRIILGEAVFLKLNIYCICSYLIKLKRNKDVCTLREERLNEKVYSKYKRLKFNTSEVICLMALKMRDIYCLKIFKHFLDQKC